MTTIDFSPLYRSSIGYDQLASMLDASMRNNTATNAYPPYNIEVEDESHYRISLAVAGFGEGELSIETENNVLTIKGQKPNGLKEGHQYLHQGIAARDFERKFQLAEHVEVVDAKLENGLLEVSLVKEIPEAMKPKTIAINGQKNEPRTVIENQSSEAA